MIKRMVAGQLARPALSRARRRTSNELELLAAALRCDVIPELLDTDIGPVLVHGDDEVMTPWIRYHNGWEAEETAFLRATLRPRDFFVDCGANFGWFSLLGSTLVGKFGRVLAIEPEPANLALLRSNLWMMHVKNVEVVDAAAGAKRGLLELRLDMSNRGNHQVHAKAGDGRVRNPSRSVPVVPLDELLVGQRVDVVKIDVQGFDHEVVRGLSQTIAANPRMVMIVEYWLEGMEERGVNAAEVLETYRAGGLEISMLQPDGTPQSCTDTQVFAAIERLGHGFVNLVLRRAV